MKAVGIKRLKARLSEYIRLVKAGESLLVTDRDEVVAEIRPARRSLPRGDGPEDRLGALADDGELTRAKLSKQGWSWKAPGIGLAEGTATRLLDELRGERSP